MRRPLRSFGVAIGLFATLVSCTPDRPLAPPRMAMGRASASATSSSTPHLIIVELMANPKAVPDAAGEYVKVYNPGPVDVDLQNYKIQSAFGTTVYTGTQSVESHTIASSVVVPVGTCVVLGNNTLSSANGGITTERYSYGTSITLGNNTTDWVTLKTLNGTLLDSVAYSVSTVNIAVTPAVRTITTPSYNAGASTVDGVARVLADPSADNTIAGETTWQNATATFSSSTDKGTPNSCDYTYRVPDDGVVIGPLDEIVINGPSTVTVGAPATFTAIAQDENDNTVSGAVIEWSSSAPSIATVDHATGVVTGVEASATAVTITASATVDGITKSRTKEITVMNPGIHWIDVSSSATSFPPGFQTQAFFTARTESGGVEVPATFTVEAVDPQLATIASVGKTGLITAVAAPADGTRPGFRITATPVGGGEAYSFVSHPITVEPPVTAPTSIYATNDEFGDPTAARETSPNDMLIVRPQYTLSYNQSRGTPNWVAYELDSRQYVRGQDRCNCFTADPKLPSDKQVFTSDYTDGHYDRGHMARSADRTRANVDNATTFYLTNIVPQQGDLNQGVWARFENALGDSADADRAVYIITGPLYSRSHGLTFVKNEGKVAIPDSTWKVALIGPRIGGVPFTQANVTTWNELAGVTVLAVNMPNIAGVRNDSVYKYYTTVDKIEEATGYDVLSLLPVAFQTAIEAGDHAPTASFALSGLRTEGNALAFDASASTDPDLGRTDADRSEALSYSWSFGDGTTGSGIRFTKTFANDGNYAVTLTVRDAWGWERTATQTIAIANVAPTVAAFAGATILPHETYSASGSFVDPGADAWTGTVNYGDGTGTRSLALSAKTFTLAHAYADAGTFTVTVGIGDATVTTSRSAVVVVESWSHAIDNLDAMVTALGTNGTLGHGEVNSLQAKLNAVGKQLDKDKTTAPPHMLDAFVNELEAMVRSGRLSGDGAAAIMDYAQRISRSIDAE